jgi:hypothetical protein
MTAGRFSVGQKVRCVREHFSGDLIVGQSYVVAAPNQNEPTCTWIEGNSYGYFSDHFVAVTDAESDYSLDSRNAPGQWWTYVPKPVHQPKHTHMYMAPDWVCSCGHTWKQKEQAEGIARALKRLCDGAEWRMGCAEYQP